MFSFLHPRRAAEPRPAAVQSIRQELRALPPLTARPPHISMPAPSAARNPVRLDVSYGLQEYLQVVRDHLPTVLAERGMAHRRLGWGSRLMMALLLPPIFLLKRWRIGDCRFEIDMQGLTRHSRTGTLTLPWRDVVTVHSYSGAYLVVKPGGAMPLPYRCFADGERRRFDAWAAGPGSG